MSAAREQIPESANPLLSEKREKNFFLEDTKDQHEDTTCGFWIFKGQFFQR